MIQKLITLDLQHKNKCLSEHYSKGNRSEIHGVIPRWTEIDKPNGSSQGSTDQHRSPQDQMVWSGPRIPCSSKT